MPRYDYYCDENGQTVEVSHSIQEKLHTWQQLCDLAGVNPGATSGTAAVRRIITSPPMMNTPTGNSVLKNQGFTKLVKRQDGTYENVTRTGTEKRFLDPSDPSSMPHLSKKITD
jgi:predicted nucleic acid-binding Zn ribbon protein